MSKLSGILVTGTLCLALTACGGGGTSNTASSSDVTSNTPSPTAADTGSGSGSGSGSGGALSSAQCTQISAAMAAAAGGVGPSSNGTDLSSMSDFLRKVSAGAPADLQGDFTTVADGLQKFYETLKSAGIDLTDPTTYSSQAAVATLSQAAKQLQSDVGKAANRIQTRFQEMCGSG